MLIKASYLILATVFFAATWFVPALSNYASGAAVLTGALFSWFLKNPPLHQNLWAKSGSGSSPSW